MNLLLKANPDVPVALTLVRASELPCFEAGFRTPNPFRFHSRDPLERTDFAQMGARGYCLELTPGLREALSTPLLASTALINKFKNYVTQKTSTSDDPGLEES
jgi:hypothetical protein